MSCNTTGIVCSGRGACRNYGGEGPVCFCLFLYDANTLCAETDLRALGQPYFIVSAVK